MFTNYHATIEGLESGNESSVTTELQTRLSFLDKIYYHCATVECINCISNITDRNWLSERLCLWFTLKGYTIKCTVLWYTNLTRQWYKTNVS